MLGHALDHHAWDDAHCIVHALDEYWDTRGLDGEAAAWYDRILVATTGPGHGPLAPAQSLWLYTITRQADRQRAAGRPGQAAQAYHQALAWLQDQPATDWTRQSIAITYHQLGTAAQDQGRLDDAEDWYHKSLAITEELGDRRGMAATYHQIGTTAHRRGRLDEAEDWHLRSLAITQEFGDRPGMALTYAALGLLSVARGQVPQALA